MTDVKYDEVAAEALKSARDARRLSKRFVDIDAYVELAKQLKQAADELQAKCERISELTRDNEQMRSVVAGLNDELKRIAAVADEAIGNKIIGHRKRTLKRIKHSITGEPEAEGAEGGRG